MRQKVVEKTGSDEDKSGCDTNKKAAVVSNSIKQYNTYRQSYTFLLLTPTDYSKKAGLETLSTDVFYLSTNKILLINTLSTKKQKCA
ncbi:MAG: hypothetical protein IPL35_05165 [Sphingobacteriales bacterium]|nr:hypothetical protein [Sphingobacteriales bacterium]